MCLVLNETEMALASIEDKGLGERPSDTLRWIARYYLDEGLKEADVRDKLESFVIECAPNASIAKWSKTIDSSITYAQKRRAVNVGYINITRSELDAIAKIESGRQTERLAFTLLCLAKYWNACNGSDSGWVNSEDALVMRLANIKTSIKRQCLLYHNLMDDGLISFSKRVDCTNVRVDFIDEDSEVVMKISDLRNLGNRYLMYVGEPFFECAECGIIAKSSGATTGRKQKYCPDCAMKVATKQKAESSSKYRVHKKAKKTIQ